MPATRRQARQRTLSPHGLLILAAFAAGAPVVASADELNPSALERLVKEPVTTSATGKPQRASDVPVAMDTSPPSRSAAPGRTTSRACWPATPRWTSCA